MEKLVFSEEHGLIRVTKYYHGQIEEVWGLMHKMDAKALARQFKSKWPSYVWRTIEPEKIRTQARR
jgi:hypothetical protein